MKNAPESEKKIKNRGWKFVECSRKSFSWNERHKIQRDVKPPQFLSTSLSPIDLTNN